ncbi:hypothetical protein ACFY7C_20555 [Streptomyces sp. NPDC012769]|uniref:hypothetical protein n=1 Tax=Streptomyces sp. NPDC012769 TaxID=3364848 RepID=UPI0036791F76
MTSAPGIEGIVLRYGGFYGPGTSIEPGGEQLELVRKRRFRVVGGGGGVWSFTHVAAAAAAAVAAVEAGAPGVYDIVDDEPARLSEWLPEPARAAGAKQPMNVPRRLGRLLAGEFIAMASTEIRGASNAKVKKELGWTPLPPPGPRASRGPSAGEPHDSPLPLADDGTGVHARLRGSRPASPAAATPPESRAAGLDGGGDRPLARIREAP